MHMCFNWKVLAGLGAVAAGVWLFQPHLLSAALPTLLVLACPLSMVVMMVGMGKMGGMSGGQCAVPPKATRQPSREDHLAQLRSQLAEMETQQRALTAQVRDLEATEPAAPATMDPAPPRRSLPVGVDARDRRG